MADYRSMFDRDFIGVWDLQGREVVVTIAEVKATTLTAEGNRQSKKPIIKFKGRDKGMVCNKTIAKTIAAMYGTDTDKWIGKRVTLFPTTTMFGSTTHECIRVRPSVPKAGAAAGPAPEGVPIGGPGGESREPGSEG